MLTLCGVLMLGLLFIGDIAVLIKGIEVWKKKIDDKDEGFRKNIWIVAFCIITGLLILLTLFSWGFW